MAETPSRGVTEWAYENGIKRPIRNIVGGVRRAASDITGGIVHIAEDSVDATFNAIGHTAGYTVRSMVTSTANGLKKAIWSGKRHNTSA